MAPTTPSEVDPTQSRPTADTQGPNHSLLIPPLRRKLLVEALAVRAPFWNDAKCSFWDFMITKGGFPERANVWRGPPETKHAEPRNQTETSEGGVPLANRRGNRGPTGFAPEMLALPLTCVTYIHALFVLPSTKRASCQ